MDTKALRQKILDLAIRGKLVPQDSNDEPASVLLERIRQQKQQMVKEGKLKPKDIKNDSVIFVGEDNLHYEKFSDGSVKCIEDEIPFELPDGWAWARLGTVVTFVGGYAYKSNRYVQNSNNLLIRIGNIKNNSLTPHVAKTCISDEYAAETSGYRLRVNDILFTMTGTRGKRDYFFSCLIKKEDLSGANLFLNQRVGCLRLIDTKLMIPDYFVEAIQSSCVLDAIFATETGNVNQGNIGSTATLNLLIPVPPTSEQYKIFERTYSLISSIDQYDIESAELLCLIHAIKSKILDLAIRGQLVPQAPADEPASVLLERIRAEKEELIRQGKIKRDKKESVIFRGEDNSYYVRQDTHTESIDEQFIFELPDNWEWCSLLNIAKIELGKTLDSAKNIGTNYPYLRSVNVRWNEVDLSDLKEMRFEPEELDRYTVRRNDLLICEGGDVGRSCVWTDEKEILYQNALHRVRFYGGCNPFYFMYYMMYYESRGIIKALCKGVTIKHLTGNVLSLIPFALPPIEEQGRIVERLNRIFVLLNSIICD